MLALIRPRAETTAKLTQTSDPQNYQMANVYCFKPPSLSQQQLKTSTIIKQNKVYMNSGEQLSSET